jgi:hypothetical protein
VEITEQQTQVVEGGEEQLGLQLDTTVVQALLLCVTLVSSVVPAEL